MIVGEIATATVVIGPHIIAGVASMVNRPVNCCSIRVCLDNIPFHWGSAAVAEDPGKNSTKQTQWIITDARRAGVVYRLIAELKSNFIIDALREIMLAGVIAWIHRLY